MITSVKLSVSILDRIIVGGAFEKSRTSFPNCNSFDFNKALNLDDALKECI